MSFFNFKAHTPNLNLFTYFITTITPTQDIWFYLIQHSFLTILIKKDCCTKLFSRTTNNLSKKMLSREFSLGQWPLPFGDSFHHKSYCAPYRVIGFAACPCHRGQSQRPVYFLPCAVYAPFWE